MSCFLYGTVLAPNALAERRPVLDQIDVPHSYYFREMYLPQLTSGPSSLAWFPDGRSLVYSMQGSLWQQDVDADTATQLTAGPGYDFQPDVAPDGRHIVFARYEEDALELRSLDTETGAITALTNGGAVNIDPRWSPDGTRLAFVSTHDTGRFHVFIGTFKDGEFSAEPLFVERESELTRYYYSPVDHELSPAWMPDGNALVYVSNRDVPYGTGSIWLQRLDDDSSPVLLRVEETTWKTRPDVAPDGKRLAYASYLGRQWHQLWLDRVASVAEPFPLTYGDFDITAPRWSPDGRRIAYITNAAGNTAIRIQDVVGGKTTDLAVSRRDYLVPMIDFDLNVADIYGKPVAARVAVLGSDGRSYAPDDAWIHADDAFDRERLRFEFAYFHTAGASRLKLPAGPTRVTVWRGPENAVVQRLVNVASDRDNALNVRIAPLNLPDEWLNWVSGDVHVHMNYGGTYRNTPEQLVYQARAEDLDVVFNLIVNKEQRIPDIAYFSTEADPASDPATLLLHAQEFHTSFWGHLGLLGLNSHLLLPDYAAYPGTAAASLYPDNVTVATLAHEQGAAVGVVHPFLSPPPNPDSDASLTNSLPVVAALGLIDYYETVGFADHRASADVWYRLLNCGLRIAAAGGTDAMANYASLRGPVGLNRTYARIPRQGGNPEQRRDAWLAALKAGSSMASNGPLVLLTVDDRHPGETIDLADSKRTLQFSASLRSAVPIDHLELIYNGEVAESFELEEGRMSADISGSIPTDDPGWLVLRAWNEAAHPLLFDIYPYATTSPVYLRKNGRRPRSGDDADYFIAWIDRLRAAAESHADYNDVSERDAVLANLDRARDFYSGCR